MLSLLFTLLGVAGALSLVARFCARFPFFPLYDDEEMWETDNPNPDLDYDEGVY